jgi:hypothetical protein
VSEVAICSFSVSVNCLPGPSPSSCFRPPYLGLVLRHFEAAAGPGKAQKTAFIPLFISTFSKSEPSAFLLDRGARSEPEGPAVGFWGKCRKAQVYGAGNLKLKGDKP